VRASFDIYHDSRRSTRPIRRSRGAAMTKNPPASKRTPQSPLPDAQSLPSGNQPASPNLNNDLDASSAAEASPDLLLPPGWEKRTTPEGRAYFVDHNNRTTTWKHPREPRGPYDGIPVSLDGPPLPSGWEAKRTPSGRLYFVDHNTRSTSWEDPRPSMSHLSRCLSMGRRSLFPSN
jgi:E3 ubiquitin-protein ligase NEDD4